jgi:hypothetical protein
MNYVGKNSNKMVNLDPVLMKNIVVELYNNKIKKPTIRKIVAVNTAEHINEYIEGSNYPEFFFTFALDTIDKNPTNLVIVAANKDMNNIVRWFQFLPSNLPTDVQMYTNGDGIDLTIGINSYNSNPAYPYVSVKIYVIA